MEPFRQQYDLIISHQRSLWECSPKDLCGSTRSARTQTPAFLFSPPYCIAFSTQDLSRHGGKWCCSSKHGPYTIAFKGCEEAWNISQKLQRGVLFMIYWAELGHGSILSAITDMGSQIWENWLEANYYSFPGNRPITCLSLSGASLWWRG